MTDVELHDLGDRRDRLNVVVIEAVARVDGDPERGRERGGCAYPIELERTARPVRFLAMRFAAKEAIVKGMGTGFAHGVWIRDVGVVQNSWGKPEVVYSARGAKVRDALGIGEGHVTLTDEAGLVVAVAVLMRRAAGSAPA